MTKSIAIIPARGGSQRIPKKNIKEFNGTPMIGISLATVISSGIFDRVIVSTDSQEIANVAMKYGAEVPFLRSKSLSDNITPTVPVISHAIKELNKMNIFCDYVCCIYPCTPFLNKEDLIDSFNMLKKTNKSFVYPVTEYAHPIQRALKISPENTASFIYPEYELQRTQDLEIFYHDAGQFYWGQTEAWLRNGRMHSEGIGFKIPNWRVVDIDNDDDWKRAEILNGLIKGRDS